MELQQIEAVFERILHAATMTPPDVATIVREARSAKDRIHIATAPQRTRSSYEKG